MIRNLLATTALATLVASGAYAQETTTPAPADPMTQDAAPADAGTTASVEGHLASNIIGESVFNSTAEDAENIGDVNDIVLDAEGNILSIVIGVGGFLGIGEKDVTVEYSEVDWAERDGDRWMVVAATKEQLEAQAAFDPAPYEPVQVAVATDPAAPVTDDTATTMDPAAPATDDTAETTAPAGDVAPVTEDTAETTDDTATDDMAATTDEPMDDSAATTADPAAPATDDTAATTADPAAPATDDTAATTATDTTETAAIDRSTLTEVAMDQIRSEDLVGTTVYGANEENIGEIGDVILNTDGQVDAVIIDVGGFLGMGEKEVAVAMENLAFMQDDSENRYLYTTFTQEQLEAATAYDEGTYADARDEQRLMMQ